MSYLLVHSLAKFELKNMNFGHTGAHCYSFAFKYFSTLISIITPGWVFNIWCLRGVTIKSFVAIPSAGPVSGISSRHNVCVNEIKFHNSWPWSTFIKYFLVISIWWIVATWIRTSAANTKIGILASYEATRNGSRRVIMKINTFSSFYSVYLHKWRKRKNFLFSL